MCDSRISLASSNLRKIGRAPQLPGVRAHLVQPRIERAWRPAQSIERHGAHRIGGLGQNLGLKQLQASDREHGLRAVHQRNAFFGCQHDRLNPGTPQRLASVQPRAFEFGLALADQHQRDVRQRCEIAARAHTALRRNRQA